MCVCVFVCGLVRVCAYVYFVCMHACECARVMYALVHMSGDRGL